ncbi:MAG: hypothetical protein AB1486_28920 [Planctomycetota bacterium]
MLGVPSPTIKRRKRPPGALHRLTFGAALLLAFASCATVIRPPEQPPHPVSVYLLDYGYHAALLLPYGDARFVKYAYGDWSYFALGKTDLWHAFLAIALPTQGTLGRKEYAADPSEPWPQKAAVAATVYCLVVDREKADALRERLEERFISRLDTWHPNATHDLEFVKDARPYTGCSNCNTVLVEWLEELGCSCSGVGWFAVFAIEAPGRATGRSRAGAPPSRP